MEKKKRFRPTVTAYRALEKENSELKEKLVRYKLMQDHVSRPKYEAVLIIKESLSTELDQLKVKYNTLLKSNKLLEEELDRVREANKELSKMNKQFCYELQVIKSRGFWARVFNL